MPALYNEIEPFAAQWIENLIAKGHVAPGKVDRRSITELQPSDLHGMTQAHFFAGIAVWSHALRLAGWPDDLPVWTGSCPCQPFSSAGQRKGFDDERHLWPVWYGLIRECRPPVIIGEQVSGPDGLEWLDLVSTDLEREGYAVGAGDICAAGVGAPHIRQRLYFVAVADSDHPGLEGRDSRELRERADQCAARTSSAPGLLGDSRSEGGWWEPGPVPGPEGEGAREGGGARRVADLSFDAGATRGFWSPCEWIYCTDGKWRPTQSSPLVMANGPAFRLADGRTRSDTSRTEILKCVGNAIVAPLAATFIRAVMEVLSEV